MILLAARLVAFVVALVQVLDTVEAEVATLRFDHSIPMSLRLQQQPRIAIGLVVVDLILALDFSPSKTWQKKWTTLSSCPASYRW